MSKTATHNINRINQLWRLHEASENCLCFFVDQRYCFIDGPDSIQMRLGVSYGGNPFTEEMTGNVFLPPPYKPGPFLFGIHLLGVNNGGVTVFDQWTDSRQAPPTRLTFAEAKRQSLATLAMLSDDGYASAASESLDEMSQVFRSEQCSLGEFEIMSVEEFNSACRQ